LENGRIFVSTKTNNKMRYVHFIIENETENQIETIYSAFGNPKTSLKCLTQVGGGEKFTYRIWDREEDTVIEVK
jgi:dsRNA-specific ribonuclease